MYYVERRSINILEILLIMFGVLIGIVIVLLVVNRIITNGDAKKELIVCRVTVIEKLSQQGSIGWYIMETENGQRIKIRSFKANTILLSVGDKGILKYRGRTLEDFQRIINN